MGKKFGEGIYRWSNGSQYIGSFYDNCFDGRNSIYLGEGKMLFADRRVYTGQWRLGKLHGRGVFEWPNGKRYSGEYQKGIREGEG